jgi:acetyltransferase-like isoleucine patch superfamily enzyme
MQADIEPNVRLGARVEVAAGVAIGAYTYVNADSVIESGAIGRFCSIASRASIGPTEHPYEQFSTHPVAFDGPQWGRPGRMPPQRKKPPSIGNDVWIGRGAVVMRGVEIGDGAVIGANAVVTHDVPPYAVACGVPARVVRYRFDEPVILRLRESRWWEKLDDVPRLISAMGAEWKTALKA